MKLHENTKLFTEAVKYTAQQMNLPAIYIEKDYWVTYVLNLIFSNSIGDEVIFKGGTALSKCYNFIDRFSEDIDLVVLRKEGETDNKLKTKLKTIGKIVSNQLPEIKDYDLTHKRGMIRKTAHSYTKQFEGEFGQVRDAIVVEATWFGHYEPYTTKTVSSFVCEMMYANGQEELAKEYDMYPIELNVLEPTRTICEKIMSLIRFSYSEKPIDALKSKIRHAYDLHQLLQNKELLNFFNSSDFEIMLLKVANDDVESFKNNNKWLKNHPSKALVFSDLNNVWKELVPVYNGSFRSLTYGYFPEDKEILVTLNQIKDRINKINWTVSI